MAQGGKLKFRDTGASLENKPTKFGVRRIFVFQARSLTRGPSFRVLHRSAGSAASSSKSAPNKRSIIELQALSAHFLAILRVTESLVGHRTIP